MATGEASLEDIWKNAVAFGNLTWGGDAQGQLERRLLGGDHSLELDPDLRHGGGRGLAAVVALLNSDGEAATRAELSNALYLGATPGWLVGLLDTDSELPQITEA